MNIHEIEKQPTLREVIAEARKCYPGYNTATAIVYYAKILSEIVRLSHAENSPSRIAESKLNLLELLIVTGVN